MQTQNNSIVSFQTLWKRAPLWRLVFMLALLSSVSFVFFPPILEVSSLDQLAQSLPKPSYTSQVTVDRSTPSAVAESPATPTAEISHDLQPHATAIHQAPPPVTLPPQTATLSLATPQGTGTSTNSTGLDNAQTGRLYSGTILANGYSIPLPDGQWVMLANGEIHGKATANGVFYYLANIEHKKFMKGAIIYAIKDTGAGVTNKEPININPGCTRKNPVYKYDLYPDGENPLPNCWEVTHLFTADLQRWADRATKISGLERAAAGDLAAKGVEIPLDLPSVIYLFTEKTGQIYVQFTFNPESDGIKSTVVPSYQDSDWNASRISHFPEKIAFLNKLKAWGEKAFPGMREAFKLGLPPIPDQSQRPAPDSH